MIPKLTAIWRILTSNSFHLFTQKESGDSPKTLAEGNGNIQDMVLTAMALKEAYNGFLDLVTEAAVEGGELRLLEELKKIIGSLEKE